MMLAFLDRMAMRTLAVFAVMFSVGMALLAAVVGELAGWDIPPALLRCGRRRTPRSHSLGNFVLLFAVFSSYGGLHLSATNVALSQPGIEKDSASSRTTTAARGP
jgi:hypothetical protein